MRSKNRKWMALAMATVMLGAVTGCGAKVTENEGETVTTEVQEFEPSSAVGEELTSSQEQTPTEENASEGIQYGDKIQVSLKVQEAFGVVEELGESEIVVASTSEEFWPWPDASEETVANNVEAAIGKHVGDTFTLWYEGGDGMFGYEYTILEIVDKSADTVAYGDRIQTSYVQRRWGADIAEPYAEEAGETELTVSVTDNAFGAVVMEYDGDRAEQNINQVIGKGVGDTFRILEEASESSTSREYTILGIHRAVEYGDRIRVSCRRSSFMADGDMAETTYETVELPIWTKTATINLEGYELSEAVTRELFQKLMGKKEGEVVSVTDEGMDVRTCYSLTVLGVYEQQEEDELAFEEKAFLLAEEENIEYFYDDTGNSLLYVVVDDKENKKIYEYGVWDDELGLIYSYEYDKEYDEQGNLIWEYNGRSDKTFDYQYDSDGKLAEVKITYSDGGVDTLYYNEDERIDRKEYYSDRGFRIVYEYESGILRKCTLYETDGTEYISEFDEWGFLTANYTK